MNPWNERFKEEKYVYGTDANKFLQEIQSKITVSGDALAIAEGEGRNAVFLAEQGLNTTTWDYAESGLAKTRKLAESRGVTVDTRLVDLEHAVWEKNRWDEVVCIFGHFPKEIRTSTLQGVKEALKPGGYFITEVYSVYQLPYKSGGPRDIDFLYRPEEFLEPFSGWHIPHFFMGETERFEGDLHNGLCHVIQLVAQKPLN